MGAWVDRARYGDQRAVGAREVGEQRVGVDLKVDEFEGRLGSAAHLAPGDEAAALGVPRPQRDVLGDAHGLDQAEILVDERHLGGRLRRPERVPADADVAGRGRVEPGQDFDQRGLARPVLPQQRMDAVRHQGEIDARERSRGPELLHQPTDLDERRFRH